MSIELVVENYQQKARTRRLVFTIIGAVIVIHLLAGVAAGLFVVARYLMPPPAHFEVKRDIRLPAKKREHRMNMAAFDAMMPKPSFNDKLVSERPTPFALPDLPKMSMDQLVAMDPSAIVADAVASLVSNAGVGAAGQGASGLGGFGSGLSFMGVQTNGKRILLLFDVSSSVINKMQAAGVSVSEIKKETLQLIQKMPITACFGMIQFTQNYQFFRPELLPATDANKAAAAEWVEKEWTEKGTLSSQKAAVVRNPNGLLGILEVAHRLQPDTILLISDGSFQRTRDHKIENILYREIETILQSKTGNIAPVHLIAFKPKPDDQNFWRRTTRRLGGSYTEK